MPLKGTVHARIAPTPPTVWMLEQVQGPAREHLGLFSTPGKATAQAEALIAAACQVRYLKLPTWAAGPDGGLELAYGRDDRSWRFRVAPYAVDAEAV